MTVSESPDRNTALLRALAERIDTSDPGACNNLGVLYYSKGLAADAVQAFLLALALAPRMRVAARNLEVAASSPGACDAPIAALEARLASDPGDTDARRDLARLFRLLARPVDAQSHLDRVLADNPDDAIALREYGLLEQSTGDLRKAQRWFERALAIDPADSSTRLYLAEVHYHRGENDQALRALDVLLTTDAGMADAHLLRAFVLGDMGHHDAATDATRRANALDPALAALQSDLSLDPRLAPASGAPAGSVPAIPITRVARSVPAMLGVVGTESLARHGLGLAFRQRGYFDEARREFDRAVEQGEDALLVQHSLAELDLVQGRPEDARRRYEALLAERGDDARLWNEHGVALHQAGDVETAAESYRRALRADPRHALAYNNLGVALDDLGDGVPAREAMQRATQLEPQLVRARLNLARWSLRHRDPLTALAVLRELVAFHPGLADAWHEMGRALLALHRTDEARQAVSSAIEHRPDHAEARHTLAQILGTLGDDEGALRETQLALGLAPVRVESRLTVGIALHEECVESVGRIDLLSLVASDPLVGAGVSEAQVAQLLPEQRPSVVEATHDGVPRALGDVLNEQLETAQRTLDAGDGAGALQGAQQVLMQCTPDLRNERPLLEARVLQLAADAFATMGVHGEAHERYQQVRAVGGATAPWRQSADGARVLRSALLGEIRSACLLGRGADVIPLVERFGSHDTRDPDVLALLAASHAALGDVYGERVARQAIQRLLTLDPRSPALYHFVGDAASRMGDPSLAILLYRRASALDPSRPSPRVAIARLLRRSGDHLAARLELVAALSAAPHLREARLALATVHCESRRPEEAIRVLSSHLAQHNTDVDALVLLAEALRDAGRADDARHAVQRARRFEPDHPMALWMDGLLLADQDRVRDARSRWGRLIAMAPGSSAATLARDALATESQVISSASISGERFIPRVTS